MDHVTTSSDRSSDDRWLRSEGWFRPSTTTVWPLSLYLLGYTFLVIAVWLCLCYVCLVINRWLYLFLFIPLWLCHFGYTRFDYILWSLLSSYTSSVVPVLIIPLWLYYFCYITFAIPVWLYLLGYNSSVVPLSMVWPICLYLFGHCRHQIRRHHRFIITSGSVVVISIV